MLFAGFFQSCLEVSRMGLHRRLVNYVEKLQNSGKDILGLVCTSFCTTECSQFFFSDKCMRNDDRDVYMNAHMCSGKIFVKFV